jgi:hypothetical protein
MMRFQFMCDGLGCALFSEPQLCDDATAKHPPRPPPTWARGMINGQWFLLCPACLKRAGFVISPLSPVAPSQPEPE